MDVFASLISMYYSWLKCNIFTASRIDYMVLSLLEYYLTKYPLLEHPLIACLFLVYLLYLLYFSMGRSCPGVYSAGISSFGIFSVDIAPADLFLAAQSSSRSPVVGWSVCLSVCRSYTFVKK